VHSSPTLVVERTPRATAFTNGLWTGRLEALALVAGAVYLRSNAGKETESGGSDGWVGGGEGGVHAVEYHVELAETRKLMATLEAEVADDALIAAIECPADGIYTGETAEDDGTQQSAETALTFTTDGRVAGKGCDGEDGAYRIREGRWSAKRVAWIEEYEQGFKVALRGQLLPDGTIRAMWGSSRGIGGAVTLNPPCE